MITFISFIIILDSLAGKCDKGCLRCNPNDYCEMCDNASFYILENQTCSKIDRYQCVQINNQGRCLQCYSDYFFDESTNLCTPVETSLQIPNCHQYSSTQICQECQQGYYLSDGHCFSVPQKIPSCIIYDTATTCRNCEENFFVSQDGSECLIGPNDQLCQFYSQIKCVECKENYVVNYQITENQLMVFNSSNQIELITEFLNKVYYSRDQIYEGIPIVCQQMEVNNCLQYASETICRICKEDYYLSLSGQCIRHPKAILKNCSNYSDNNDCLECFNGYRLENNICIQVSQIPFCVSYDGTSNKTICLQCYDKYILKDNSCQSRVNYITNCITYSSDEKTCIECANEFILSNDNLKCLYQIEYCSNYQDFDINTYQEQLKCLKCLDRFYLEDNSCLYGGIEKCLIYQNAHTCTLCENQYYIYDGRCYTNNETHKCLQFDSQQTDLCILCAENYYSFEILTKCNNQEIPHCIAYEQETNLCIECEYGYELSSDQCKKISIEFCSKTDNENCIACAKGFGLVLNSQNKYQCVILSDNITDNCYQTNFDSEYNYLDIQKASCQICEQTYIPYNFSSHFICIKPVYMTYYGMSSDVLVNYCVKYDLFKKCIQCEEGFYLNSNRQCIEHCEGTIVPFQISTNPNHGYIVLRRNYCDTVDGVSSCQIMGFNQYTDQSSHYPNSICLKCKPDHLPVIKLRKDIDYDHELQYSIFNPDSEKTQIKSPKSIHPQLNCLLLDNKTIFNLNGSSTLQLINNCQYYYALNENQYFYGCVKCQHQYKGKISSNGYIEECILDTQCSSSQYEGFDIEWQSLYSCHACQNSLEIPFLIMDAKSIDQPIPMQFRQYDLTQIPWASENSDSYNNICQTPIAENFGVSLFQLPENCATAFVNLLSQNGNMSQNKSTFDSSTFKNLAIYCTSCKPGYKSISLSDQYSQIKIECQKINNCTSNSQWVNYCSECQNGYSFEWKNEIDYTNCIPNDDDNCYAGEIQNEKVICKFCKKGYNFNYDGKCEKLQFDQCSQEYDLVLNQNLQTDPSFSYYISQDGLGCASCSNGYIGIQISQNEQIDVCLKSDYQKIGNFPSNSKYIQNCKRYQQQNDILSCYECDENYGLYSEYGIQICGQKPSNCLEIKEQNKCLICKDGYSLINNECVLGSISNCLEYETTSVQKVTCRVCQNGYLLNNQTCSLSEVENCKIGTKENPTKCDECKEGYFNVQNDHIDQCLQIPKELFCKGGKLIITQQDTPQFMCSECINGQNPINNSFHQCLQFKEIQFCLRYGTQLSFSDSNFYCEQCHRSFYLSNDGRKCEIRKLLNENCISYENNEDKCHTCKNGYYITNTGICSDHKNYIEHCELYEQEHCIQCGETYYLEGNQCLPLKDKAQNCKYYDYFANCIVCDTGYCLNEGLCLKGNAKNCLTYLNQDTCGSCLNGYGLVTNSQGYVDCLAIEIDNCISFQNIQGFPCIICDVGYYPDYQGRCQKVKIPILNCVQYISNEECFKCVDGYALKSDFTACLSIDDFDFQYDINCSNLQYKPTCVVCRSGSYFEEDTCVKCPNASSCYKCNPVQPWICDVCAKGYYMDVNGNCFPNMEYEVDTLKSYTQTLLLSFIILLILIN